MAKDNPARRLLFILEKGKKLSNGDNTKNSWFNLLEIQNRDEQLLFSKLSKVMNLPSNILEDVKRYHPEHLEICNKSISVINHALYNQNLSGQWTTFNQHISDEIINYIKLFATLLDYEYETDLIEEMKLDEIRISVNDLIKEVMSLELDINFKRYLLSYLKKIIDSIDDYKIMGISPIVESLEIVLGHNFMDKKFSENIKESNLSEKFINILEKLNTLIDTGNNLSQITNGLMGLLPK